MAAAIKTAAAGHASFVYRAKFIKIREGMGTDIPHSPKFEKIHMARALALIVTTCWRSVWWRPLSPSSVTCIDAISFLRLSKSRSRSLLPAVTHSGAARADQTGAYTGGSDAVRDWYEAPLTAGPLDQAGDAGQGAVGNAATG